MKKIIVAVFLIMIGLLHNNVFAKSSFYINNNGIEFTETEYNKINSLYSKKKIQNITSDEFNKIKNIDIISNDCIYVKDTYKKDKLINTEYITKAEYEKFENQYISNGAQQLSNDNSFVETTYKKLSLSLVDTGSFLLVATLNWSKVPKVRSYDILAFRVNHFTFSNVMGSQVYYVGDYPTEIYYNSNSAGYKGFSNGAGISMNLKDGSEITDYVLGVTADLQIKKNGHNVALAYADYQHAVMDVSRTFSKRYTLDVSGYGNTILLDSSIESYYDHMGGVHVSSPIPNA